MRVQLSDHFTYPRLLRFTLPSITMMIFTSIYGVVDGLFVSNFVGKTAFAAVNFIMPLLMGMGALGFMVGSGGSALVSRTLGEGDRDKAEGIFSMLVYVTLAAGVALTLLGQLFLRPIAAALGRRARCWKTACSMAASSCCPPGPSCCKMCSKASSWWPSGPTWA